MLAILLVGYFVLPQAAQAAIGQLEVMVVDADTGRELSDALVQFVSRDQQEVAQTTNEDGVTNLSLEAGLYTMQINKSGYVTVRETSVRVIERKRQRMRIELSSADQAIEEITVTAARAVRGDRYGASSNSYLNREELRTAVGAGSDVMRALDGLPGLISTGDFASFSVRGHEPRENLIYVDGFPFDKVVHFDQTLGEEEEIAGGGRYSIFAPNSIAGAEFSPGGWSAEFGGKAGSLVQLKVAEGAPTASASLRLDLAGIEVGYDGPSGFDDDTTLLISARHFDFGQLFDVIDEGDIGDPEMTDLLVKSVTQLSERDRLEVLAVYTPETFTREVGNVLESPNFEDASLLDVEQDSGLAGFTWHRLVAETGQWANRFYYRDSEKTSSEGEAFPDLAPIGSPVNEIPAREDILTIHENEEELGWRSDFSTINSLGKLAAGLSLSHVELDFETVLEDDWIQFVYELGDEPATGQSFVILTPENTNSRFTDSATSYAAYIEQTIEMNGGWSVRTGARFEHSDLTDENLFSPRFSARWESNSRLQLSATAGLFHQLPRYLDFARSAGESELTNEEIAHLSIGFEYDVSDQWQWLVEVYYQDLDNLLVDQEGPLGALSNVGDGTSYGVDSVLRKRFSNRWSATINYSYNDSTLDDNDGRGEYTADYSREHFFAISGVWEINQRWQLAARWKYGSARLTDDFEVIANVLGDDQPFRYSKVLTSRNTVELDDYHSLNLRIDYRRSLGYVDFVGFLDVINVYGGDTGNTPEWDPRRGVNVLEEGESFPLIGIIFERSW